MEDVCFWSVGNGDFAIMLQVLVNSFHRTGMEDDFIVFSDKGIKGAKVIPISSIDKSCHLFKFQFLKELALQDYKTFIFLDADTVFVRKAPSLKLLLKDSPAHAFLESDCTFPALRKNWWGCPLGEYVRMMRDCGVYCEHIYNVNGGFFMVERQAIDLFCSLANDFWQYALSRGYVFTEEAPLAYAIHMLCQNPENHLLKNNFEYWATDWTAQFGKRLPDGNPWIFKDWLRGDEYRINPAIVHAVKSKELLIQSM